MPGHVIVTDQDATRVITLRRPEKKNAITQAMYRDMSAAIDTAQGNPAIRCIIISGGPGVFTAGNDLEDFLKDGTSNADAPRASNAVKFLYSLAHNAKPIVAAVDGIAIGIGSTLLFHCDYVVASTTATFSTPFIHLGLVPEGASSLLVPCTMGHQRAFAMLVMGRALSQRRGCPPRRLRQYGGGAGSHRNRGPQGGARDLRAAGGSGRDLAKTRETVAGRPDPKDRSGKPSVRRADAFCGSDSGFQGVLFAEEGLERVIKTGHLRLGNYQYLYEGSVDSRLGHIGLDMKPRLKVTPNESAAVRSFYSSPACAQSWLLSIVKRRSSFQFPPRLLPQLNLAVRTPELCSLIMFQPGIPVAPTG
jgi:hypothetical protein